jgi:hypothetical protein
LEKLIRGKADSSEVGSAKQKVSAVLAPLLSKMEAVLKSNSSQPAPQVAVAVNPAQSREAAGQLQKLLSEFDPGAADFVESNQAALRPLFAGDSWTAFEKLVQSYSFADAQTQLEQASKNFST